MTPASRILSPRRLALLVVAALAVGGWLLARAEWPGLSTGKAAIVLLIADIVLAPPLLFLVPRRKQRRKREATRAAASDGTTIGQ